MTQERTFEIYLHRCTVNGKGYVGITSCGVRARLWSHESEARHGSSRPFARAIRKHGIEAFETTVLASGLTESEAHQAEQEWIAKLGTFGSGGYNATLGGEGTTGLKCSPARREAISKMFSELPRTEQHRRRVGDALRGRPGNWELIERLAAAKRGTKQDPARAAASREALAKGLATWTGMKHSGEAKRKMRDAKARLIDIHWPDGRMTTERTTYRDLAELHGLSHSAIWSAVKAKRPISKECGLRGCKISLFTKSAMTMEEYEAALADPAGPFSS